MTKKQLKNPLGNSIGEICSQDEAEVGEVLETNSGDPKLIHSCQSSLNTRRCSNTAWIDHYFIDL
jgi:hypothetical protein